MAGLVVGLAGAIGIVGKQINRQVARHLDPEVVGEIRADVKCLMKTVQEMAIKQAGIIAAMEQDTKDRVLRQKLMDQLCQDCRDRIKGLEDRERQHA